MKTHRKWLYVVSFKRGGLWDLFWLMFVGFHHLFVALSPCLWLVDKILPFHLDEENKYYMNYSEGLDSCQMSLIWHQHGVTREQGPIKALVSFTLQRNLVTSINWACAVHTFWAISWHWLRLACSGSPATAQHPPLHILGPRYGSLRAHFL